MGDHNDNKIITRFKFILEILSLVMFESFCPLVSYLIPTRAIFSFHASRGTNSSSLWSQLFFDHQNQDVMLLFQVIYSRHKLRDRQLQQLDRALESIEYVCGTNFRNAVEDGDTTHIFFKVSSFSE